MPTPSSSPPESSAVLTEVDDVGVATITLNRPEAMNAWNADLNAGLDAALAWSDESSEVRAIVVTGAGRAFCAGADLSGGGDTFDRDRSDGTERDNDTSSDRTPGVHPHELSTPVIAAINGHAVGVGATFSLLCDMRFMAVDAKIGFVFVRRGMLPELGSHALLPRVVGFSNAADLLMTGRAVGAAEAERMGLVSSVHPTDEVLAVAQARAREIAVHSAPVSTGITKRLLWEGLTHSVDQMRERENPLFDWVATQPDAREGVESFLEKRDPKWHLSSPDDLPDGLGGRR